MRRAAWRRLPGDPRSPLGWWWRDARPWAFALAVGASALGALYALAASIPDVAWVLLAAPSLALVAFVALQARPHRDAAALEALTPLPPPVEGFPVEVALFQGAVCTGRDSAVASFVDGWLVVEGLRAGFCLRPVDTFVVQGARLELPGGEGVELRSLGTPADRATFAEALRVWRRFAVESPLGEPTLPPSRVHATALSRPLSRIALCALAAVFWAFLAFWAVWGWGSPQLFLAPPLALAILAVGRVLNRAVGDLRALAALDREAREEESRTLAAGEGS